ncbi:MAG: flagellar motor switch protein FliG [Hyphomicrobiaceae bacterium]
MSGNTMAMQDGTSSLEGVRGVATLLLAMEKEDAARLLGKFDEEEIKRIANTAAELGTIANEELTELVEIFENDLKQEPELVGSEAEAERLVLGGVADEAVAGRILASVRGELPPVELWARLPELPPEKIVATLGAEHPQVIAFALSQFDAEQAAEVIGLFDPTMRQTVFDKMIDIGIVTERSTQLLEFHLAKELLAGEADEEDSGMHARMAGIMNRLDRAEVDEMLGHFDAIRPKAAKTLRGLIFSFEDVVKLSDGDRKILFEAVPTERIIVALREAPETLTDAALSSLTGRSRRMVEMELQSASSVPEKEISDARRWIADLAIELAQDDKISIQEADDEKSD